MGLITIAGKRADTVIRSLTISACQPRNDFAIATVPATHAKLPWKNSKSMPLHILCNSDMRRVQSKMPITTTKLSKIVRSCPSYALHSNAATKRPQAQNFAASNRQGPNSLCSKAPGQSSPSSALDQSNPASGYYRLRDVTARLTSTPSHSQPDLNLHITMA